MQLWTIQLAKWRLLQHSDVELIDVTLATGLKWMAPSPLLLASYKGKRCTDAEYEVEFLRLCRERYREKPRPWQRIAQKHRVAFACYCPKDCFCHRLQLIPVYDGICQRMGIEFEYCGEIVV